MEGTAADTGDVTDPRAEGPATAPARALGARFPLHSFVTLCTDDDGRCTARVVAHEGEVIELLCSPPQQIPAVATPGVDVTLMPIASARFGARGPVLARTDTSARIELRQPVPESQTARRQPRVAADEPVELTLVDSAGLARRRGRARMKDLSADGCGIVTALAVIVGAHVRIAVRLAGRAIEVNGRVVRMYPTVDGQHFVGVDFDPLTPPARDAIATCVRARAVRRPTS